MNSKGIGAAVLFAAGIGVGALVANGRDADAQGVVAAGQTEPSVVDFHVFLEGGVHRLYRLWSDGTIDLHRISNIDPPSSMYVDWYGVLPLEGRLREDINIDGCVDAGDLAQLLGAWDECKPLD